MLYLNIYLLIHIIYCECMFELKMSENNFTQIIKQNSLSVLTDECIYKLIKIVSMNIQIIIISWLNNTRIKLI